MTLPAGKRLGPYEVLAPLGAGGMGEVYRARDNRLSREVAIKVLPAEVAADQERLKRFEKEARSASSLNHPSIVTIYEIGQADSVSYIAMELVDGRTLRELVASGPLPIRKLLQIGSQVADGLARAHDAGIVHRDLKPENVMVTKDGLGKILDFGLAKLTYAGPGSGEETNLPTQTATTPGVVMGTVGYMSPEQASGRAVDFRSDQFSFGSLLYEMATGKKAFARGTAVQTLAAIIQEEPEAVGSINPQAPVPLRWIVERCLAKEPEDRYASTRDLARELATVRDHLSEATTTSESLQVAKDRLRSRLLAAVALAALFAGLTAGFFWGTSAARTPPPRFHQITFRRGAILTARFAPDGQTIVYGALWERLPAEIFAARPESPESRSLGLPPADILSISNSGDMAVHMGGGGAGNLGTLAVVPLAGGAPRPVLENVRFASWASDGKTLAVIHSVGLKNRLEFPIGKVLHETTNRLARVRVSPKGDLVAFNDGDSLLVSDRSGKKSVLHKAIFDFAWSPGGNEIWFCSTAFGLNGVRAVNLAGQERLVTSFGGIFVLHEISRDGRVLLERGSDNVEIVGLAPGETKERNLAWLDKSMPVDLSADGKTLLFNEEGAGGGPGGGIYIRGTDGSPAVRLGDGRALALSPDGNWVLSVTTTPALQLVLLPTAAGQTKTLERGPINEYSGARWSPRARWFPDGRSVAFTAREAGHEFRSFVQSVDGGPPRPVTPEGIQGWTISPDGNSIGALGTDEKLALYPLGGGPPRPVAGVSAGDVPLRWGVDGRSLFVRNLHDSRARVYRVDLSSGRKELWKEFTPSAGADIFVINLTPDGKSWVYGLDRYASDLFLVDGLR